MLPPCMQQNRQIKERAYTECEKNSQKQGNVDALHNAGRRWKEDMALQFESWRGIFAAKYNGKFGSGIKKNFMQQEIITLKTLHYPTDAQIYNS